MMHTVIFHSKRIRDILCDKIINHLKQNQHSLIHQSSYERNEFHIHDHVHSLELADD